MDESVDAKTDNDQPKNPGTVDTESGPENAEMVEVEVRITPLSLLLSSVLGASMLTAVFLGGVLLLPTEMFSLGDASSGGSVSLLSSFGLELAIGFVGLVSVLFVVGYRRHGRPVPTMARAWTGVLAVQVPAAWGTLIREELHLKEPSLETPRKEPPKTGSREASDATRSSNGSVLARGTAPEWWDPGTYEVRAGTEATAVLASQLAGDQGEKPTGRRSS